MNHTILLRKLIAIERSIGAVNNSTIRDLLQDAETYVLEMQKESVETLLTRPGHDDLHRFHSLRAVSRNPEAVLVG